MKEKTIKMNKELEEKINFYVERKNKNQYVNASSVTALYNELFHTNKPITTCGSCLRRYIQEMENYLNKIKKEEEVRTLDDDPVITEQPKKSVPKKKASTKKASSGPIDK